MSIDPRDCPYCKTEGVYPMSGNICPNCKHQLDGVGAAPEITSETGIREECRVASPTEDAQQPEPRTAAGCDVAGAQRTYPDKAYGATIELLHGVVPPRSSYTSPITPVWAPTRRAGETIVCKGLPIRVTLPKPSGGGDVDVICPECGEQVRIHVSPASAFLEISSVLSGIIAAVTVLGALIGILTGIIYARVDKDLPLGLSLKMYWILLAVTFPALFAILCYRESKAGEKLKSNLTINFFRDRTLSVSRSGVDYEGKAIHDAGIASVVERDILSNE